MGQTVAEKLDRIEIHTIRDLLFHWPRAWLDLTHPMAIAEIPRDQTAVIEGVLSELRYDPPMGKRRAKVSGIITDSEGGQIPVVWHNQPFLVRLLKNGQQLLFIGQAKWNWQDKCLQLSNPSRATERAVLPIYPETAGITSAFLRSLIAPLLNIMTCPNALDESQVDVEQISFAQALRGMHAPVNILETQSARRRLALDELVHLQYQLLKRRETAVRLQAPVITPSISLLQQVVANLPFQLTPEQRRISWDIIQLLAASEPVRHVLQGDVGTGKTVVGLLVAISVLEAGYSVYWMAPTQLLARQLCSRLKILAGKTPFDFALVTSTEKPKDLGRPTLYVGTQALLNFTQSDTPPALVIVDEQHRFGVEQQQLLLAQGAHLLTMTATPIPRALLLTLYGNHTLSQLRFRPNTQTTTTLTTAIHIERRQSAIDQLSAAIQRGEQGFVVVPRIDAGQDQRGTFPSLQEVLRQYKIALPKARIEAFHGRLTGEQQQIVMNNFLSSTVDILVATTIIEVGLDVPNATVMLIEKADWFGLAQLHQLRGRVGRGSKPGSCMLIYDGESGILPERLAAFCRLSDGFALAELDLKLRGPGDLLGELQSGWNRLRLADPTDTVLAKAAQLLAESIQRKQPKSLSAWLEFYEKEEGGQT